MTPFRIALVLPAYLPASEYGGPIAKVRALASGLRDLGHIPQVWCADYGANGSRVSNGRATVDGISVMYFRPWIRYRWSPVVPAAAWASRKTPVDIGHCFGAWDGLTVFAAMGFRGSQVPYVVEPLGMYPPAMGRQRLLKRALDVLTVRAYVAGAAAIIANSAQEAERITAHTSRRTIERMNPILLPEASTTPGALRQQLAVPEGATLLGWIGRISRSKGLDVLIDALALLPDCHLAVVGPDDRDGAAEALDATLTRTGMRHRVHLVGPLWGQERDRYLASLDVFVLPSVVESFGNAAFEAASLGVPVVVSAGVGAGAWLRDAGAALVAPLEARGLARAIEDARARSKDPSATVVADVRAAVAPAKIAADQAAIYRDVLGSL